MSVTVLLKIGAIYHLFFAVFHLFWPKLFKWDEELKTLGPINKILLPIMSGLFVYIYLVIFFISMFCGAEFISGPHGKFFLLSVALFWVIRTIMQLKYTDIREKDALVFFIIFIAGVFLYSVPLIC